MAKMNGAILGGTCGTTSWIVPADGSEPFGTNQGTDLPTHLLTYPPIYLRAYLAT